MCGRVDALAGDGSSLALAGRAPKQRKPTSKSRQAGRQGRQGGWAGSKLAARQAIMQTRWGGGRAPAPR